MRNKPLLTAAIIMATLFSLNIMPAVQPPFTGAAPPPPVSPTATLSPAGLYTDQPPHTPPSPGVFPPEVEQARARQAIQAVLEKHLRYWGPRYRVAPVEVTVEGEWAHGVARWRSQAKTLSSPIHILAHRLPDGTWQALMPGSEGLYLQWLDAVPESLVPAGEKSQLRAQAVEADALQRPQATFVVPPAVTAMTLSREEMGEPAKPIPGPAQCSMTPTPVYSIPAQTEIVMVPGTVAVRMDVESAVRQALSSASDAIPPAHYYSISDIETADSWLFVSVVGLKDLDADLNWNLDNAIWVRLVLLHQDVGGHWSGAVEGTTEFSLLLANVPENILNATDKQDLDPFQRPLASTSGYRFPWQPGTSMQYGSNGVHNAGFISGWKAVDFLSDGNTGAGHAPNSLRAAAAGTISYVCRDGTSVAIRIGDLLYAHLLDNSNLTIGHYFNQGDEIGQLRSGSFNDNCGWADQGTNWFHVHWGFPDTGSFEAGGWTLNLSDGLWRRGSETRGIYSWFQAESGGTCPQSGGVILYKHANYDCGGEGEGSGYVIRSSTGWQNVPGSFNDQASSLRIPSGWSVRLYEHSDRNGASVCRNSDDNDFSGDSYDGGGGLNDSVSSFEVFDNSDCGSGPPPPSSGTWDARYDQGSTCWWDPNCNMNPRCTETINGPELHKDWGSSAPCGGMNGDDWVGDFRATINFPAGEYVFHLDHDDGVKLWLNGQNIQDRGGSGSGPVCNGDGGYYLDGDEDLRVLLREEGGDAHVHLTWSTDTSVCTSPPSCDATSLPSGYSQCAEEGEWCSFSGTQQVYYGANSCFKIKSFTDGVGCNNDNFGDPVPGVHKACYIPPQAPDPPSLQSPANGSTFNEGESINLSWSDTGNEYYGEVWGGPGGTLTFGWQSGTSYNLGSQWAGYTYSWHVKARNDVGESGWSDTWTFTVKPAAPSNLSAQTASCNAVNLYWTDNSGNEEGYRIYRNGSYVGQVGMNTTSYQDTGLSENTGYSYYVKAFRGSIESDASNTVNITTPSCAPPQPDLMPSQWGGWQYPVVPSSITGTNEVNTLYAGYVTYIDWGLSNVGDVNTGGNTYGDLYIDDTRIGHYDFGDVLAGQTWGFFDWGTIVDTPGWHTLKSVADPDDLIDESDEGNNVFQRDFYWTPVAPYTDDMENGTNDWTATGLWHQVDAGSPYPESRSGSHSWWYGQDSTGNYDTGAANSGDLTSPPLYIPDTGYYLRFWYRYETETQGPDWDQRWVQISVDDGPFNNALQLYDGPMNWWLQSPVIDLSGYAGHTIRVRFHFDTLDAYFNDYRGWYIDDFEISTTPPPSCADTHEPNNTPAEATAIAYGQTLSADICPGGDYDFYTFTGNAGDKVVVDIDAESDGSLLDSYIYLLDSDGTDVLDENDDEILAEVHDSHLGYQLPYTGTYYIKVKAWNHPSVGGIDYFYTIHLLTDDTSPNAEITSPDHYAWLDPDLQTVATDVSDGESGIRNVVFYWHDAVWDGTSDWVVLEDDRDPRDGWTYDLDTSGIPEQSQGCVVFIYAYDWAGNYKGYGSYSLGLDRTPPTVTASVYPMYGGAPFRDFWVDWWDSSDNLSGIADYDVQYRDGAAGTWTDLVIGTTDVYTRFVGLDGHTYYFRARARDYAGNQSTYAGGDGDVQHTVDICDVAPDAYEADDTAANARWLLPDGPMQVHNFHVEEDQDWIRFYAAAGITYTLATTSTSTHADTVIYLYDGDGTTLIDYNDDYPDIWPLSRLDWSPSTSGFYLVKVQHWDPWAYGCTTEYGLSITGSEPTPFYQTYLPLVLRRR